MEHRPAVHVLRTVHVSSPLGSRPEFSPSNGCSQLVLPPLLWRCSSYATDGVALFANLKLISQSLDLVLQNIDTVVNVSSNYAIGCNIDSNIS